MPTVPRVQQSTVKEAGLPDTRIQSPANLESFGGGQSAQNVSRAATGFMEAVVQEKERADTSRANDFYSKLATKKQELLYGNNGALKTQGSQAFGAKEKYGKEFDAIADELEKEYTPSQLETIRLVRKREKLDFDKTLYKHVYEESKTYEKQSKDAGVEVAKNEAILAYNDPEKIEQSLALQKDIIVKGSAGLPKEEFERQLKEAYGDTHKGVLDRMVDNGMETQAEEYFQKNKDMMGKHLSAAEDLIKSAVERKKAQTEADKIVSSSKGLKDAYEQTSKIEDSKLREETTKRVKDFFAIKKQAEAEEEDRNAISAFNLLDRVPDVDKIPRSMWNNFSGPLRRQLETYASDKASGKNVPANGDAYVAQMIMLSSPQTRQQAAKQPLHSLRGKVTDSEFKELLKLQTGILKGDPKANAQIAGVETINQVVTRTLKNSKIQADSDEGRQFFGQLNSWAQNYQIETGKKPTTTDIQQQMDNLLTEVVVKKRSILGIDFLLPDKKAKVFELQQGQEFEDVEIDQIPKAEKEKIVDYLERKKKPINDQSIIKLYKYKVGASRGR